MPQLLRHGADRSQGMMGKALGKCSRVARQADGAVPDSKSYKPRRRRLEKAPAVTPNLEREVLLSDVATVGGAVQTSPMLRLASLHFFASRRRFATRNNRTADGANDGKSLFVRSAPPSMAG
jgi:hypothetical protein